MTQFEGYHYLLLESFKKNGQGIRTTVWFVEFDQKLYIWTIKTSGKAKRIYRNPKVRICPSSIRGNPKGTWKVAQAHFADSSRASYAIELIRKKYGYQYWIVSQLYGKSRVIVELSPTDEPTNPIEP